MIMSEVTPGAGGGAASSDQPPPLHGGEQMETPDTTGETRSDANQPMDIGESAAAHVHAPHHLVSPATNTTASMSYSVPAHCAPFSAPFGAPPRPPFPVHIPPQILQNAAEMIAAARVIQQQRMQQQQGGSSINLPPIRTTREPVVQRPLSSIGMVSSQQAALSAGASSLKRKKEGEDEQAQFRQVQGTVMGVPVESKTYTTPQNERESIEEQQQQQGAIGTDREEIVTSPHLSGIFLETENSGELLADSSDDEIDDLEGSSSGKKARLVWTQELHNRFLNALSHLGLKHAVPKTILTMMNVDGMTRENVASHLQKYRLHLKKMGGYDEKDRVDSEVLQQLHEQNIRHLAAQQAAQQFSVYHPTHSTGGVSVSVSVSAGAGAGTGTGMLGSQPHGLMEVVEGIPVYPESLADLVARPSVPVSGPTLPVSPTVTAAVEAGGRFNPQGWQYPPIPLLDGGQVPPSSAPPLTAPEDILLENDHLDDPDRLDDPNNTADEDRRVKQDGDPEQDQDDRCPLIAALPSMNDLEVAESLRLESLGAPP